MREGLAIVGEPGGIDGINLHVRELEQNIDQRSFGLFDGDAEGGVGKLLSPDLEEFSDSSGLLLDCSGDRFSVEIREMVSVELIGPVDADADDALSCGWRCVLGFLFGHSVSARKGKEKRIESGSWNHISEKLMAGLLRVII